MRVANVVKGKYLCRILTCTAWAEAQSYTPGLCSSRTNRSYRALLSFNLISGPIWTSRDPALPEATNMTRCGKSGARHGSVHARNSKCRSQKLPSYVHCIFLLQPILRRSTTITRVRWLADRIAVRGSRELGLPLAFWLPHQAPCPRVRANSRLVSCLQPHAA